MDKAKGSKKKIKITMDGPYEVSGDVPLKQMDIGANDRGESVDWVEGKSYEKPEEPYHLCRCGHSRTKPFCDGSHDDAGFCGREHANRPPYEKHAQVLEGPGCSLLDDQTLCVGARFCDVGETVWGYVEKSDNPENVQRAIEEACKCPSGRLTVVDSDGKRIEPNLKPEIGVVEDPSQNCRGPLWVKGGIEIEGANEEKYEVRNRVALCRCGESKNQPYCDGSHYNCPHMQGLDE